VIDGERDGAVTTGLDRVVIKRGGDSDCAQIYPAPLDRLLLQERFQQCTEQLSAVQVQQLLRQLENMIQLQSRSPHTSRK
jgi:hypothetical protein